MPRHKIVFATTGSHGDLHPILAVAAELAGRGHEVIVATDRSYRERVEASGVSYAVLRPGKDDLASTPDFYQRINHGLRGTEFIVRELMLPRLRDSAADLIAAAHDADLLVSHPITYAAPIVADRLGLRWAATALQPIVFLSAFDPPALAQATFLLRLRFLGPGFHRAFFGLARRLVRRWMQPVYDLRKEWGLPPPSDNPLFRGQFSPHLNLALFSPVFAAPQVDWPQHTVPTGFPLYRDQAMDPAESDRLERYLAAGPAPVVFTLGTTAVYDAGPFYQHSLEAVKALGVRAIFLIGDDPRNVLAAPLPEGVTTFGYVPFGLILPRAAATVHQGGVGTTAQALRAGRPQVVVPFANDQPDNAARVVRLGVGLTVSRRRYSARTITEALRMLLASPAIAAEAARVGCLIQAEDGAKTAADAIEAFLATKP